MLIPKFQIEPIIFMDGVEQKQIEIIDPLNLSVTETFNFSYSAQDINGKELSKAVKSATPEELAQFFAPLFPLFMASLPQFIGVKPIVTPSEPVAKEPEPLQEPTNA